MFLQVRQADLWPLVSRMTGFFENALLFSQVSEFFAGFPIFLLGFPLEIEQITSITLKTEIAFPSRQLHVQN